MCINRSFLNLEKVPFLCIVFLREGKKLLIIKKLIKIYLICFCLIFFLSEIKLKIKEILIDLSNNLEN